MEYNKINIEEYLKNRFNDQLEYFEDRSKLNQKNYRLLKTTSIVCNILTTLSIALAFTVQEDYKQIMGIIALILSTIVLATYQWEEFQNYGAKWEKFRLVAEQLKSEKWLYINSSGQYAQFSFEEKSRIFIEKIEGIIKGTDITFFSLMVDPGKRIEKRLSQNQ